mgnify:CR=1 FL=1
MERFAQIVSIIGHPLVILPVCVFLKLLPNDDLAARSDVIAVIAVVCLATLSFSWWQVRRGAWVDLDASVPSERKMLVTAVVIGLLCLAIVLFLGDTPSFLWAGVASAALIVLAAALLARWCKLSLHTAFAVHAAMIFVPNIVLVLGLLGVAMLIGWSRLILERHGLTDIVVGYCTGLGAGIVYLMARALF